MLAPFFSVRLVLSLLANVFVCISIASADPALYAGVQGVTDPSPCEPQEQFVAMELTYPRPWYVGEYSQKQRHGYGATFIVPEHIVGCPTIGTYLWRQYRRFPLQMVQHGWWQRGKLVNASIPVPMAALAKGDKYRQLVAALEGLTTFLTHSRHTYFDGRPPSERATIVSDAVGIADGRVQLLCNSSRIEADRTELMFYVGGVSAFPMTAASGVAILPHGHGRWVTSSNRTMQEGTFHEGWLHSEGLRIDRRGSELKANNFRHGVPVGVGGGRWQWNNGRNQSYDGELLADKPHGHGELRGRTGSYYRGPFRHGVFDGSWGIQFRQARRSAAGTPSTSLYRGGWCAGRRCGAGLSRRSDGTEYVGEWLQGKPHGVGRRIESDGTVNDGEWVRGQLSGYAVQLDAQGTVMRCGKWKANRLTKDVPVPLNALSPTLRSSLPSSARLIDRSPFAFPSSLIYFIGTTDEAARPHGEGSWLLESDAGFTQIFETTRLIAPACSAQTGRDSFSIQSSWQHGLYVRGVLQGYGSRWYPNGDHFCGHFASHRKSAVPDGLGVLFVSSTDSFVFGSFRAGALASVHAHSNAPGVVWREDDCFVEVAAASTSNVRRKIPLFSQDRSSGHIEQYTTDSMMEGHMWSAAHPVDFSVWWNTSDGRMLSSSLNFHSGAASIPTIRDARVTAEFTVGGMQMSFTIRNTSQTISTESEKSNSTAAGEPLRYSSPVPTALLWNTSFMSVSAALSSLIYPAGFSGHQDCKYAHYHGQLNDELTLPSGRGAWFCSDGRQLEGGRYIRGKLHGRGMRITPNGNLVEGFFSDGLAHGHAVVRFHNGDAFNGTFTHGLRGGRSAHSSWSEWHVVQPPSMCYGDWANDRPHGLSACIYPNGTWWSGQMLDGQRTGEGILVAPGGRILQLGLWNQEVLMEPVVTASRSHSVPEPDSVVWVSAKIIQIAMERLNMTSHFGVTAGQSVVKLVGTSAFANSSFRVYAGSVADAHGYLVPDGFGHWVESTRMISERGWFRAGRLRIGTLIQRDGSSLSGFFVMDRHLPFLVGLCCISGLLGFSAAILVALFRWLRSLDREHGISMSVRDRVHEWRYGSLPLAQYLVKRSLHGIVDTGNRHLLYRSVRPDEVSDIRKQQGITAKLPDARLSMEQHVRDGSKPGYADQFISATSELAVALQWVGVFGSLAVLRFSKESDVTDLSSSAARLQHLRNDDPAATARIRERTHAGRAREVLFSRHIPQQHVALCHVQACKIVHTWPPNEFERIQLPQMNTLLFPAPAADGAFEVSEDAWIKHVDYVGSLRHVEHRVTKRHYLSSCGQPNLHWTTTFEQPYASTHQLRVQCQSDVIAQLIYRMLNDANLPHVFPACVLYLCQITYSVSYTDARGRSTTALLPRGEDVPLLLYEFSADAVSVPRPPAPANPQLLQSLRGTLWLDALLMVIQPDELTVARNPDSVIARYAHLHCLDKRPDHGRPPSESTASLILHLLQGHSHIYEFSVPGAIVQLEQFLELVDRHRPVLLALLRLLQSCRLMEKLLQDTSIRCEHSEGMGLLRPPPDPLDLEQRCITGIAQLQRLRQVWRGAAVDLSIAEAVRRTLHTESEPPPYGAPGPENRDDIEQ